MIELVINMWNNTVSMFARTKRTSKLLLHSSFEQIDEDSVFMIFDKKLHISKNNIVVRRLYK